MRKYRASSMRRAGTSSTWPPELPIRASLFTLADEEHVLLLLVSSHRQRRLVYRRADAGPGYGVRGPPRRASAGLGPAAGAVRGLCPLWQHDLLGDGGGAGDGGVLAGQIEYWRQTLAGLPEELALPYDRPRPAWCRPSGAARVRWELADPDVHAALARLARDHQVSIFMVLHAGLAALLSRMGAGPDIPLGAAIAGRTDEAVHDLVGFFVNTLVLRADVSGDPGFGVLVGRVREAVLAGQARQDVPFERLVEVLNPVRSAARHPLFQVMIADQDVGAADWRLPGLQIEAEQVPDLAAKFDLTLGFQQDHGAGGAPGGIGAFLEYDTDLFDESTVRALAGRLAALLRQAAVDPGLRVSEFELLTAGERRLLAQWNDTVREVPETTMPELFRQRAERTPDAPAVIFMRRPRLTYAELNARANQLARYLIGLGARARWRTGRHRRAPLGCDDHRGPGRAQVGRGVPAGRPGVPGGPDRVHAG